MPSANDVMQSLGFLALKAREADEARQAQEFAVQQQQDREASTESFGRMTQLMEMLDRRREASRKHDLELAQTAGEVGLQAREGVDDETKGRFDLGAAITRVAEERRKSTEDARAALENARQGAMNARTQANIDALDKRSRDQIAAADARREADRKASMDRTKMVVGSREKIAGKKAAAKGAGGSVEGVEVPKGEVSARLREVRELTGIRNELQNIGKQLTDKDVEALTTYKSQFKNKWNSLMTKVIGGDAVSDEDIQELERYSGNLGQVARLFNALGKERSGASFTEAEVARLRREVPTENDNPKAFRSKLNRLARTLQQILREKAKVAERTTFKASDVEEGYDEDFALEDQADEAEALGITEDML